MSEYVFEKLTLIEIDAPIWSGERAIPKDELKLQLKDKDLKNQSAVKPGKIELIHRDKLAPFKKLRTRAQNRLLGYGTRYMSAIGVPNDLFKTVKAEIDADKAEFLAYKRTFLFNYDTWVNEFAQANPDIQDLILSHKKDVGDVEGLLDFNINVFKIAATEDTEEAKLQLERSTSKLSDGMYGEIALMARKVIRDLDRDKRQHFSPKIHGTFQDMLKKMRGLSFLDESILPLCEAIDSVLAVLPKKGRIQDQDFITALGLLTTLSDPKTMRLVGEGKAEIKGPKQPGLISMMQRKAVSAEEKPKPDQSAPTPVDPVPAHETENPIPAQSKETPPRFMSPMGNFKL